MQDLVDISRRFGADPDYVVAGGGNTSWKDGNVLYVKGSGTSLAEIGVDGFVRMDRKALAAIWSNRYPEEEDARESAVLADLMTARMSGEENKRPSVETLLHDILPFTLVVHTHPALVNGLTCSAQGERAMIDLFGEEALWIPLTNPGYILAVVVKDAMEKYRKRTGKACQIIFLQNHGIFVASDAPSGINALYSRVMKKIRTKVTREADFSSVQSSFGESEAFGAALRVLAAAYSGSPAYSVFRRDTETAKLVADEAAFAPVSSAYTPDHIVYSGSDPLFVEEPAALPAAWKAFTEGKKRAPKLVALRGTGAFGLGGTEKAAQLAVELFMDSAKVAAFTEPFGGPRFMTAEGIAFINNWEVERYRSKIST